MQIIPKFNIRKALVWLAITLSAYVLGGIFLYKFQEYFLFHPVQVGRHVNYGFNAKVEEEFIPFNYTDTMHLVKFKTTQVVPKGVVLYFHGNERNVSRYAAFAKIFTDYGWEVWMEDYPGFGKSRGILTEQSLYTQSLHLSRIAAKKFTASQTIIYGRSLGTGVAANVAANSASARLILETPYYSIPDLMKCYNPVYPIDWMMKFHLPTYQFVQNVSAPITIIHGTGDWIIPYRCAAKLKPLLKPGDEFVTIKDGKHNNLSTFPEYNKVMDSLLSH